MVSHSKPARPRLADLVRDATCGALYHPWTSSCAGGARDMVLATLIGSGKFFFPVYLAQLLLNWRKVNRSYLKKEARAYLQSIMFTTFMSAPFVPLGCILSRLIGYHDYISVFVPAFVGGFGIFVEQPHKRGLLACSFTAMVLEYVLHQLEDCGVYQMSQKLAALLFMASNGLLMYLMRCEYLFPHAKISKNIWFFHPPPVKRESNGKLADKEGNRKPHPHICPHRGPCLNYIMRETSKYTLIGVGLQLLRKGIPKLRGLGSTPSVLFQLLCERRNMQLGVFLGAYISIYTVVSCTLNHFTGHDSELHAICAGALAGLAYWFQPNIGLALTGFTTAVMLLARHLVKQETVPSIPSLVGLLFATSYGILLHARAFEDHLCPRLAVSLTNTTTNGRCGQIVRLFELRREAVMKSLKLVT